MEVRTVKSYYCHDLVKSQYPFPTICKHHNLTCKHDFIKTMNTCTCCKRPFALVNGLCVCCVNHTQLNTQPAELKIKYVTEFPKTTRLQEPQQLRPAIRSTTKEGKVTKVREVVIDTINPLNVDQVKIVDQLKERTK